MLCAITINAQHVVGVQRNAVAQNYKLQSNSNQRFEGYSPKQIRKEEIKNQKEQEKEDVKEKQNERREKPKRDEERESVKQRKEDKKIIYGLPDDFFSNIYRLHIVL